MRLLVYRVVRDMGREGRGEIGYWDWVGSIWEIGETYASNDIGQPSRDGASRAREGGRVVGCQAQDPDAQSECEDAVEDEG